MNAWKYSTYTWVWIVVTVIISTAAIVSGFFLQGHFAQHQGYFNFWAICALILCIPVAVFGPPGVYTAHRWLFSWKKDKGAQQ